jgi:hypothetical protein
MFTLAQFLKTKKLENIYTNYKHSTPLKNQPKALKCSSMDEYVNKTMSKGSKSPRIKVQLISLSLRIFKSTK